MAAQAANAMAPDGLDVYEVSRDNLFALALDCTAVAKPPAPSAFKIPRYEAMGLWLAGVTFDLSDNNVVAMLEASNIIEHELRHGDISMLNLEAARNGIFGSKIKHYPDLAKQVCASTTFDHTTRELTALYAGQPFGGANPCPAELEFLRKVSWAALYRKGLECHPEQPGCLLALATLLLGSRLRHATRNDDNTHLRVVAEMMLAHVGEWGKLKSDASTSAVARQVPHYLAALYGAIPLQLRTGLTSNDSMLSFLRDGHVLLTGKEAEVEAVMWQLVHRSLSEFSVIGEFDSMLQQTSETKLQLERLLAGYAPHLKGNPYLRVCGLDREMIRLRKRSHIVDMRNSGSTAADIVDAMLDDDAPSRRGQGSSSGGGGGGGSGGGAGADDVMPTADLTDDAVSEAISAPTFRDCVTGCAGLAAREFLEVCFMSGSMIVLRYLVQPTDAIRRRHKFFVEIDKHRMDMLSYFNHALTLDPNTGETTVGLEEYTWTEKEMMLFLRGRWLAMDTVNEDGGFADFAKFETNTRTAHVPREGHYLIASALAGSSKFMTRLLTSIRYPADPIHGFSIKAVYDTQTMLAAWVESLPAEAVEAKRAWAKHNFEVHALERASRTYLATLNSGSPATECFDGFLDMHSPFFSKIVTTKAAASPLVTVQRAFPHLMPNTPRALPGAHDFFGTGSSAPFGAHADPPAPAELPGGGGGGGGGGKGKRKQPGSSAQDLTKDLGDDKLFIAGTVFDVAGIAKHCGCQVKDKCWRVLLSTKEGEDKLVLCSDPAKHGGINSKMHTAPPKFKRQQMQSMFSSVATNGQLAQAGWSSKKTPKPNGKGPDMNAKPS